MKKNGIALITVLMSLALISIFLSQLIYTSRIDLTVAKKNQKRIQAYYLAHSAARMGLLRIHIYKEVQNMVAGNANIGSMFPPNVRSMVWSFPLPEFPLPPEAEAPKSEAPGTFMSIVKGEGSKIPINLLDGEFYRMPFTVTDREYAKDAQQAVRKQIQGMIELREETDENFRRKFQEQYETAYVDALQDWIDTDNNLAEGGDESAIYERKNPPYRQRNNRMPNLSEVSMVNLWDDDLFSFFKNEFSIYNLSLQISCNTVSMERIKLYSKNQLTDASLGLIAKRRLEEPFTDIAECERFIRENPDIVGGDDFAFPEELKDKGYSRETVFTVEGSSNVGASRALIRLYVRLDPEPSKNPPANPPNPPTTASTKTDETGKFQEVRVIRFEEGAPK